MSFYPKRKELLLFYSSKHGENISKYNLLTGSANVAQACDNNFKYTKHKIC